MQKLFIKLYTKLGYRLLVALNYLFKIRIGELESRKVGHFATPPYIYICEQQLGIVKAGPRDYYFFNKNISNSFLESNWRSYFSIKPRIILEPIFHYAYFKKNFKILTPYRSWRWHPEPRTWQGYDVNNATIGMPSFLKFSNTTQDSFNALFEHILNDSCWNGELVTFHIRTPYFQNPDSPEMKFGLRDSDFADFQLAIESLLEQGFAVLRIGKGNLPFDRIKHPRYIDLSLSPFRTDELEFFVLQKTFLHVCTGAGFDDAVAIQLKRRVVSVNATEWDTHLQQPFQLIAPKKFFCQDSQAYLSFKGVVDKGLDRANDLDVVSKMNIKVVGLSKTEILGCVNEAIDLAKSGEPVDCTDDPFSVAAREVYGIENPVPLSKYFLTCNPWFLQ